MERSYEMISDLVVNISILISFIFLWHQIFSHNRLTLKSSITIKMLDGLIGGVLGIVLMYYSIQVNEFVILDLRHIPVVLLAYFGGFIPSMISVVIISIGRFVIDVNHSSIVSLFMMLLIGSGASIITYNCKNEGLKKWTIMLLYSQFIFSIAFYLVVDFYRQVIHFAFYHIVSTLVGGFFTFYFVTYIRRYSELYLKYKENSERDSLTGLYNVRSFDYFYNLMVNEAKEKNQSFAVCLVDIDYFKNVNDLYGHVAGDEILKQLARILEKTTRREDIISRNGGEEFSVLLQDCCIKKAVDIALRIQKSVSEYTFLINESEKLNITVSIGVAACEDNQLEHQKQLYQEADDALYKAKHNGRNRVCLYSVME